MRTKTTGWKKGEGKLGILAPLFGTWQAKAVSPMGKVRCTRTFTSILQGKYVQLAARWQIGKRSEGVIADGRDIHPLAIAFEAEMPAGRARMIYWPDDEKGFSWAVEARTKKGWRRFTEHHYVPM